MKLQDFLSRVTINFLTTSTSTIAEIRWAHSHALVKMTTGPLCDTPDKLAGLLGVVAHEAYQQAQRASDDD